MVKLTFEVIGRQPRPRTLLVREAEPDTGPKAEDLSFLPTLREVTVSEFKTTPLHEWDAVIFGNTSSLHGAGSLPVILFGPGIIPYETSGGGVATHLQMAPGSNAEEFILPVDGLDSELQTLIKNQLVPALRAVEGSKLVVCLRPAVGPGGPTALQAGVQSFLEDGEGNILAGALTSNDQPVWLLPHVSDPALFVRAAFNRWAIESPEVFTLDEEWMRQPEWMTAAESLIRAEIDAMKEEIERLVKDRESQVARLEEEFDRASENAAVGLRRLLTETSGGLVDGVFDALRDLGFQVHKRDDDSDTKRAKLEDLTCTDGNWTAIVEVRGYKGGAAVTDLQRISRFAIAHASRVGAPPNGQWYVVNQFRFRSPSQRPAALNEADDQVEEFAEANGLVVDTRELYKLLKLVDAGEISREDARRLLTTATGRFVVDSHD